MELHSETRSKITPALIAARKNIEGAEKSGKGNWGKYASCEDLIECCMDPLLAENVLLTQGTVPMDGKNWVVTQATHASGEFMRSYTEIVVEKQMDPKKALAGQTYARRGGIESLLAIPRLDDDGNNKKIVPAVPDIKPNSTSSSKPAKVEDDIPYPTTFISAEERSALIKLWKTNKMTNDEMRRLLTDHGINGSHEIPKDKLDALRAATLEVNNA